MNKIIIIGNLTRDPELRTTQSGVQVCSFTVAVQRRVPDQSGQRPADFIPVVAWRQLAELCSKYLAKGRQVAVEGSLQVRSYEDKDGNKRTAFEIQADEVQFLGAKPDGSAAPSAPRERKDSFGDVSGFTEMEDSVLPF